MFWNYVNLVAEKVDVDDWNSCKIFCVTICIFFFCFLLQYSLTSVSQEKQHNIAIRLANSYLGDSRTDLLKFALSIRVHSPTVQLFQQVMNFKYYSKISLTVFSFFTVFSFSWVLKVRELLANHMLKSLGSWLVRLKNFTDL